MGGSQFQRHDFLTVVTDDGAIAADSILAPIQRATGTVTAFPSVRYLGESSPRGSPEASRTPSGSTCVLTRAEMAPLFCCHSSRGAATIGVLSGPFPAPCSRPPTRSDPWTT